MQLLSRVWSAWKRLGQKMGDFIGRLFLTLFYFIIFLPFGLGSRFGADFLRIKQNDPQWLKREPQSHTLESARRSA
jgi:hypothetical protein